MRKVIVAMVLVFAAISSNADAGGTGLNKIPPAQEAELSIMEQIKVFFGLEI